MSSIPLCYRKLEIQTENIKNKGLLISFTQMHSYFSPDNIYLTNNNNKIQAYIKQHKCHNCVFSHKSQLKYQQQFYWRHNITSITITKTIEQKINNITKIITQQNICSKFGEKIFQLYREIVQPQSLSWLFLPSMATKQHINTFRQGLHQAGFAKLDNSYIINCTGSSIFQQFLKSFLIMSFRTSKTLFLARYSLKLSLLR
eukprot:TRINITY_DN24500_c0_g1_i1.p2 TRINITY_DN24500_c0_g1~~TRINITY_DN24500_c0_g1_i1.p2  ORF type:complete len:201 (+),score=-12.62 TRINITY_DN24500_c0_g1_i1:803-1405(+)